LTIETVLVLTVDDLLSTKNHGFQNSPDCSFSTYRGWGIKWNYFHK